MGFPAIPAEVIPISGELVSIPDRVLWVFRQTIAADMMRRLVACFNP